MLTLNLCGINDTVVPGDMCRGGGAEMYVSIMLDIVINKSNPHMSGSLRINTGVFVRDQFGSFCRDAIICHRMMTMQISLKILWKNHGVHFSIENRKRISYSKVE